MRFFKTDYLILFFFFVNTRSIKDLAEITTYYNNLICDRKTFIFGFFLSKQKLYKEDHMSFFYANFFLGCFSLHS
jgi:hypothetical protein